MLSLLIVVFLNGFVISKTKTVLLVLALWVISIIVGYQEGQRYLKRHKDDPIELDDLMHE